MVELASFLTIGAAQGKTLSLFGTPIDADDAAALARSRAVALVGRRRVAAPRGARLRAASGTR